MNKESRSTWCCGFLALLLAFACPQLLGRVMRLKIIGIDRRRFTQFIQPGDFFLCHFPFRGFQVVCHLFRSPDSDHHGTDPGFAKEIIQSSLRDCAVMRRRDFFQFLDDIINFLLVGNCSTLTESCAFGPGLPAAVFPG